MLDAPASTTETASGAPASTGRRSRRPERAERPARPKPPLRRRLRLPAVSTLIIQVVLVMGDRMPSVDAASYFETGRNVIAGNGYVRHGTPELHFPPVAPVSLGALEWLLGSEMAALRVWNLVWGLAIVAVLTLIGWFISRDDDVAVATAWLATLVPGVVVLATRSGSGSELAAAVFVLSAALVVLVAYHERFDGRPWRRHLLLAGAGALLGLAYLTRPEALLPAFTICGAAGLMAVFRGGGSVRLRAAHLGAAAAAMGATLLLFVGPYLAFQHANTGHWAATSKNKDASIDAWRAVAQNNRLERDQILYAIQPDGVSLGPETRSLSAMARENPRNWLTIGWINTKTMFGDFNSIGWRWGPVWTLIPAFITFAALGQMVVARRERSTLLFAVLAMWPLVTCFFFFALPRYLIQTAAILIPFGAWGLVRLIRLLPRGGRPWAWALVIALCVPSFIDTSWLLLPGSPTPERTEQRAAGRWLAANTPEDARVMTRSFHVQSYSDREIVALPYADYPSMLEFARRMGVTYLVADETTMRHRRPELYPTLMRPEGSPEGLELVHEFTERGQTVKIYRLDPAPPPSDQPPLWLGYVAD